jgi:hypothetical protein
MNVGLSHIILDCLSEIHVVDIYAGTFKLKSTFKHFDRNGSGDIDIVREGEG